MAGNEGEQVLETRPPTRGHRIGAIAALASAVASAVWAYLQYTFDARPSLLALALTGVLWGVAATVLLAFRAVFPFQTVQAPRPVLAPATAPVDLGVRTSLVGLLGGAFATLLTVALLPLRSCGTSPRRTLRARSWRRGVRLLTPEGRPIRPSDPSPGSATAVVPASAPEDANSIVVLVRLRQTGDLVAFSRVCTHAGCAVCVFRCEAAELECPCHHSVFDVRDHGRIVSGPASRRLPALPLAVDDEGFLIAGGELDGPIGPQTGLS